MTIWMMKLKQLQSKCWNWNLNANWTQAHHLSQCKQNPVRKANEIWAIYLIFLKKSIFFAILAAKIIKTESHNDYNLKIFNLPFT